MKQPLWIPDEERINRANMTAFMRYAEELTGRVFRSYQEVYEWSVTETEEFWKSMWVMSGIIHSKTYKSVLTGEGMQGARWFSGARLNFAENMLRFRDTHTAIISEREGGTAVKLTYEELYRKTAACARKMREMGVRKGDRAAGFVTNTPEAVIGMLAAGSIGAVWSSCSPDFGFKGVMDRFGQIKPKILFAAEGYSYGGKRIDCTEKIKEISRSIPEIENIVLIPWNYDLENRLPAAEMEKGINIHDMLEGDGGTIEFEQLPFDHPVYIMYSSGTTGVPKCIVHGAGGTLLQHYKELVLHTDLNRHDVITYYTTCGWMMWNWLVSALHTGATIYLYEGSPVYPQTDVLWRKIEERGITIFGTSPKYISICQKAGAEPGVTFNLKSLRTVLSTGAPLAENQFEWVYEKVKRDVQLASISGGTDIISCFMLGNPVLPVYAGEIQCRGLGMKVEAYDEEGRSVTEEKGELVCTAPFPSMPVYFWNDEEGEKYREAYFSRYEGVWHHGDYIKITERGGVVVYGRSDATLNPGGIRIGTAEIYRIVESLPEIADSIAAGYNKDNDVKIMLFVVPAKGFNLDEGLILKIKNEIRKGSTPRHVPDRIIEIKEVPHTINGKKVELAVGSILNGGEVKNKEALANPDSLLQFEDIKVRLS